MPLPGALYCAWGGQPFFQCWCFWDFSFSTYGPTTVRRTTWPCDLDLWPWRSWQLSVIRVFVVLLCTRFEDRIGLPIRKILRIYCVSINRFGDLDLWPLNSKQVHGLFVWWALPSCQFLGFGLPRPFRSRVRSRHATDGRTDRHRLSFYNTLRTGAGHNSGSKHCSVLTNLFVCFFLAV